MSLASEPLASAPRRFVRYETILRGCVFVCITTGIVLAVEPSPYDVTSLVAMALWFVGGFKIHRVLVPHLLLWLVIVVTGFAALMPYWDEPDPRLYQMQTAYVFVTLIFFSIYCSERTIERLDSILKAYALSAVVTSVLGLLSYVDAFGLGVLMPYEGRVAGTFKDPNLFGSYLILAANVELRHLITRRNPFGPIALIAFGLIMAGIFLSFSRGSWGATIASLLLVVVSTYTTSESPRLRRRIMLMTAVLICLVVVAFTIVLATPDLADFFTQRAKLTQDYDEGVTGRFGNQIRAVPMLLERFWGFGPLRYRLIFDLEPHNSFLGAFANGGWIEGFAWIGGVLITCFVGFRLMFAASPFRPLAQTIMPALLVYYLQGFQIDIDHWRQLYLCMGAIWGLEAARQRWMTRARPGARAFDLEAPAPEAAS